MSDVPAHAADLAYMARALRLAERGLYSTTPNPRVGCVLVRDGQVIGEGWHRAAGSAHAEVEALASVAGSAQGACAYVTLEPCSHHGRTPPCADALLEAKLARVVIATEDPSSKVDGRGIARLRAAGMTVQVGILGAEARALNPGFESLARRHRPWVRLKLATSLDGRTAMANGHSHWITGPQARSDVQHWRARSSAVVTGAGTVRADCPRLDVRPDSLPAARTAQHSEPVRQPTRVILTSDSAFRPNPEMLATGGPVLVMSSAPSDQSAGSCGTLGAEWQRVPEASGGVDLGAVLSGLADRGHDEVWVECGATLAGSLLGQGLVDELIIYVAPTLLGHQGRPLAYLPGLDQMSDRLGFGLVDVTRFGEDVRLRLTPQR